ncbi:MAG TPA: hypothetical protein VJ782_11120 [Aeromicrobium sp.]|nr:hypothetical protein [Aeromicrobium sp.]
MEKSRPPSPLWYLAALALTLVGWIVGVAVAGGAWDAVRSAPITSANQALQAKGESIAVFTDVVQADRHITCSLVDVVRDAEPEPIPPAPIALTVDDDGATWNLVAFEPEGRDNVTVTCTPKDKRVDNAQYAYAAVDGFVERARAGNFVILGGFVGGIVMAIVVFAKRRRRTAP